MDLARPAPLRLPRICGAVVAGIGAAALLGWATTQPILLGFRASYIPMAPNSAVAFITLGTGLWAIAGSDRRRWGRRLVALRMTEFVTGVDLAVDSWFLKVPAARFGLHPVGKMAFATAATFLTASVACATLTRRTRGGVVGDLAGGLALLVMAVGLVFGLGYLFSPDAPLLYGSQVIPMALNTALGFAMLGAGLVAVAGPEAFPMRRLTGPSTRARLLRVFLPLVIGTVGVVAWLTHVVTKSAGAPFAALSSAALAIGAIALFSAICERIARRIGAQLERAEVELQRAHDELEIKVEERTRDLSRANGDLSQTYRDLKQTHEALQQAHLGLKQAQSRMLQQAKMASLGQTAAGVAHEINNPLAFVTSNIAVLKREVSCLHDILRLYQQAETTLDLYQHELLGQIHDMAEKVDLPYVLVNLDSLLDRSRDGLKRIQKIVVDLRDFAHLDEADLQEVDLNAGVATTVSIMRSLAERQGVALETDLGPIPPLSCYPAKVNLVIQNLISNAIDACPAGGQIQVSTRPVGDDVEIRVADTGSGIDPAIRDRVFDPFFTTKPIGKGTGLGLSMSYGIVKDHGGTIDFEPNPGRGTSFFFRLPAVAATVQGN